MIKRLLGKQTGAATLPAGRLITEVEVSADRSVRLSDGDVERIAARLAERLLDGPMRDTVTRVVADVAERMVRDEIARMRAAVRARGPEGG